MKKLLFLLIAAAALVAVFFLLALTTPAQVKPPVIQRTPACSVPGNTSKIVCSLAKATTAGSTIRIVEIDRSGAGTRTATASSGKALTATSIPGQAGMLTIFTGASDGSTSFAVTLPNAYNPTVWAQEDTGGVVVDVAPPAVSASGVNKTPQPISAVTLVTTTANDYALFLCEDNFGAGGLVAASPWNVFNVSAVVPGGFADQQLGTSGSYSATGTLSQGLYIWTCAAVAFKPGGAPPPPPPPNPPTVTLGAIPLAGTVPLTATAAESSSGVTITKVQFTLDGAPLNAAVTAAPYTTNWNTTTTSNGTHTIGATATNSAGQTGTAAGASVLVNNSANPPPMTIITPVTLPTATQNVAYTANLAQIDQLTGGVPPYTFTLSSGSLPASLTLSAAGVISGTPSVLGTFNFGYTITDSSGTAMAIDGKSFERMPMQIREGQISIQAKQ